MNYKSTYGWSIIHLIFFVISRTLKNIYWGYSLEAGNVKVERYRDIERPSCRVSGLRISDLESPRLPIAISWNEGDEVEYNPAVEAPTQTRLQTRLSVNYFSALLSTIIFRLREKWVTMSNQPYILLQPSSGPVSLSVSHSFVWQCQSSHLYD